MKRKKLWLIVSAVLLLLLTLTLVGCSTMGTLFNCFTNLIGCSLQTVGKCNTCNIPYVFWSLASCGVLCRNCDVWKDCGCGETHCYDNVCVEAWISCGEGCKSATCRDDTVKLGDRVEGKYPLTISHSSSSEFDAWNEIIRYHFTVTVRVKFEGEDLKYDNVTVDCKVGDMTSSRWIGSAKSGKEYKVECEFYCSDASAFYDQTMQIEVYGVPVE